MSEQSKEPMLTSRIPVEHLVYSDGLAMVSIYVEKLDKQPDIVVGASNFGGINTYAVYTSGYQITAVGEVPKITVKLMADSVEPYQ
jgi:sigma-E factor negative regulatory protein RseB